MHLHLPQLIYIIITALSLGINMTYHGKPKTGKENFFMVLISQAIMFSLLLWGGFFN